MSDPALRVITFDIETKGAFTRGMPDTSELSITVVGVHDSFSNSYTAYTVEELPLLWPVLEQADLLVGYNSNTFDIPILNKYYPSDLTVIPSLDLLAEIYLALGRRLRLDSVAQATLKRGKSGEGKLAGEWWDQGEYEKVKQYCLDDVRLTRELFDFALKEGKLRYKDLGAIKDIKLDTSHWLTKKDRVSTTQILPL